MSSISSTAHNPPRCLPPPRRTGRARSTAWRSSSRRAPSASSCGPGSRAPRELMRTRRARAQPARARAPIGDAAGDARDERRSPAARPDLHAIFGMDGEDGTAEDPVISIERSVDDDVEALEDRLRAARRARRRRAARRDRAPSRRSTRRCEVERVALELEVADAARRRRRAAATRSSSRASPSRRARAPRRAS